MALSKFALVAFLLFDISLAFRQLHGNITVGLPPLKQKGGKKGNGVLKVPVKQAKQTSLTRRQDSIDLENVNNAYLIQCKPISIQDFLIRAEVSQVPSALPLSLHTRKSIPDHPTFG
jgi:hypothetical protein